MGIGTAVLGQDRLSSSSTMSQECRGADPGPGATPRAGLTGPEAEFDTAEAPGVRDRHYPEGLGALSTGMRVVLYGLTWEPRRVRVEQRPVGTAPTLAQHQARPSPGGRRQAHAVHE